MIAIQPPTESLHGYETRMIDAW